MKRTYMIRYVVAEFDPKSKNFIALEAFDTVKEALVFIKQKHASDSIGKKYCVNARKVYKTWNG